MTFTIEALNTDCFLEICSYLDVFDHISLVNTSQYLRSVVREHYRKGSIESIPELWKYNESHGDKFNEFINTICDVCSKLVFEPLESNHTDLSHLRRFSNLKKFKFHSETYTSSELIVQSVLKNNCMTLQHLDFTTYEDCEFRCLMNLTNTFPNVTELRLGADTLLSFSQKLVEMFPKLKILHLYNVSLEQDFPNFPNLTELIIERCRGLSPRHLKQTFIKCPLKKMKILRTLDNTSYSSIEIQNRYKTISQCQSLEELFLDFDYFCMFGNALLKLKNLRMLSFDWGSFYSYEISADVFQHIAKRTKTMTFDLPNYGDQWPMAYELKMFMQSLTNVENLKVKDKCGQIQQIRPLTRAMKNLREFHYHGNLEHSGNRSNNYIDILCVLENCRNIEILDFTHAKCNELFMEAAVNAIHENFMGRELPLLFRISQKDLFEKVNKTKKFNIPKFLEVTYEKELVCEKNTIPQAIQLHFE